MSEQLPLSLALARRLDIIRGRQYTAEDLAYAAGLLDGEGCLAVELWKPAGASGPLYRAVVAVDMADQEGMELLVALFGGRIVPRTNAPRKDGSETRRKDQFRWKASGPIASAVAEKVLPHLRIKREQAMLLVALNGSSRDGGGAYLQAKALNKRGR